MPSPTPPPDTSDDGAIDVGLLSPVTAGHDAGVSDAAVLDALVTAEVALTRAYSRVGAAPGSAVTEVASTFGWQDGQSGCRGHGVALGDLVTAAVAGGNPVIPLVGALKARVSPEAATWIHRGATSQDILDTALVLVARDAAAEVAASLAATSVALAHLARVHRDEVAAARTLTQHAVPTTVGARVAGWLRGVDRARAQLNAVRAALPAQLGGAAGTAAAFAEHLGSAEAAAALVDAYAAELGLAAPAAPWHTERWPITELGDALVQALDAVGKIATDVATLSRTEIGEVAEGAGGGSSAMPQKQNPAASVLLRSAALRAPQLGATLHLAAALAADERPDGAWHAEWPTLRELLRLALGASAHAARLTAGLRIDAAAVAENLAATGGLLVSERLSIVLTPLIGGARVRDLVAAARGDDLAALLRALPELEGTDVADLLDPAAYTGLAGTFVDRSVAASPAPDAGKDPR
ncbi:3-carboxy-cis,cis-muconate cycloisomerase [Microbacterium sp. AK009]|uniref:lyase family protein n=1 Tax=Microbacterium sp. AK009 TaxID=2723068 RepID=UPI0017FA39E4|nr:lyase family protein [Microbacterium sp. AK009]NYF15215.1 3-carboxy-cis,cis-muconate cycloisomerase [Microbacterium sp. AK009]